MTCVLRTSVMATASSAHTTFAIRRLDESDAAAFRDLRLDGLARNPEAFGASLEDEQMEAPEFFAGRLRNAIVLGGFDSAGALAGVVGLRRESPRKMRHTAWVWGMYVRPAARGGGLGRQLMQAVIDAAPDDVRSIRLAVGAANEPALRLYRSFGFEQWAFDVEALQVGDRFYDEVLMRLDLK